jgi:hypothetical protein
MNGGYGRTSGHQWALISLKRVAGIADAGLAADSRSRITDHLESWATVAAAGWRVALA